MAKQQRKSDEESKPKGKRYSRKKGLRERYDVCEKTIDRWRLSGRIPPPDFYQGPIPFWSDDRLDKADAEATKQPKPAYAINLKN